MRKYFRLKCSNLVKQIKEEHREEMQIKEEEVKFLDKTSLKVGNYFLREAGNGDRKKSF